MSVDASQVWEELGRGLPIPLQGFQCGTQQSMRLGRIHLTTGLESILKRFRLCLLVRVTDSCRRLGLCGNASACTKANSSMASRSSLQPPRLFRSQPPHQTTKPIRFSISHEDSFTASCKDTHCAGLAAPTIAIDKGCCSAAASLLLSASSPSPPSYSLYNFTAERVRRQQDGSLHLVVIPSNRVQTD